MTLKGLKLFSKLSLIYYIVCFCLGFMAGVNLASKNYVNYHMYIGLVYMFGFIYFIYSIVFHIMVLNLKFIEKE